VRGTPLMDRLLGLALMTGANSEKVVFEQKFARHCQFAD
jgi:hypothetical protein